MTGALFEHGASQERKAFEFGVEQVNRDVNILRNTRLIYMTESVNDVFSTSKKGKPFWFVSLTLQLQHRNKSVLLDNIK